MFIDAERVWQDNKLNRGYLWVSWRRKWQPTPVLLPGESHGRRSLVGYSPWVAKSRTRLSDFTFTFWVSSREKCFPLFYTLLLLKSFMNMHALVL